MEETARDIRLDRYGISVYVLSALEIMKNTKEKTRADENLQKWRQIG
jgi:hypothetical protein